MSDYRPPFRIRPSRNVRVYGDKYEMRDACIEDADGKEVDIITLLELSNAELKRKAKR